MSKYSLEARVEFIFQNIEHIEIILQRHDGIVKSLSDEVETRPALLMALMQIGETLGKLDEEFLIKYDVLDDSKGSYDVRNFIAHDYMGVDLALVEDVIRNNIPILKTKVQKMIEDLGIE
jgi:uncharacterized protein with HEPN domain